MTAATNGPEQTTAIARWGVRKTDNAVVVSAANVADRLMEFLPANVDKDRWMGFAISATRQPELAECAPQTVIVSLSNAARLNLSIGDGRGHAYLVAFKNKKSGRKECQLIVGYKGFIDLAYRSGRVRSIDAEVVHELDYFRFDRGQSTLEHRWDLSANRGPIIGSWAKAYVNDSPRPVFAVVTRDELDTIASRSRGFGWRDHFVPMAKKTAVRRLANMLPQSAELAMAARIDDEAEQYVMETPAPVRATSRTRAALGIVDQPEEPSAPALEAGTEPQTETEEPSEGAAVRGDPDRITDEDIPF